MSTLEDRQKDNHRLVSLGLAYDDFGGASAEKIDYTKKMVK